MIVNLSNDLCCIKMEKLTICSKSNVARKTTVKNIVHQPWGRSRISRRLSSFSWIIPHFPRSFPAAQKIVKIIKENSLIYSFSKSLWGTVIKDAYVRRKSHGRAPALKLQRSKTQLILGRFQIFLKIFWDKVALKKSNLKAILQVIYLINIL